MGGNNYESPWLVGSTHENSPGSTTLPGEGHAVWADDPRIMQGGDWRPEELRTVEHPLGRVATIGECLATPDELRIAASRALETDNPAILATLPGSYTSIVVDKQGYHFVGDTVSQFPLYIRPGVNGATFSTHTAPFRSGAQAAPPDRLSLALGVGLPWVNDLRTGRTPLEGVTRTLPQEVVHVCNDGRITKTRHDSIVPDRPLTIEEASERLREAMLIGAERRIRLGRAISVDFSGGYDSTSAAYFFARSLDRSLPVVTKHSPDIPLDDLDYVRQYLALPESAGLFDHHAFAVSAAVTKYGNLEHVAPGDVPDTSINIRACDDDYFAFLRSLGAELHISGNGADELFDMQPREYLGQFAHISSLPHFIRTAFYVARAEKDSPKHVIADSIQYSRLEPRGRLLQLAQILGQPGTYDSALIARIFGSGSAPNWLTKTMRKEVGDYAAAIADGAGIPPGMDAASYKAYDTLLTMGISQSGARQQAAGYGLRLSSLFYDNDVVRSCLGLPAHERMDPRVFKQLMGRAFSGIVPAEVTSRKTKGDYSGHAFEGLRGSRDFLRAIMKDSRLASLGIVDPAKVSTALERAFLGLDTSLPSLDMVIATELWLRSLGNESWDGAEKYMALPAPPVSETAIVDAEPLDGRSTYGMPKGVLAVTRQAGGMIVNLPTGEYHRLGPYDMQVMLALQQGGSVAAAYEKLAEVYFGVPRDELEQSAEACIKDLLDKGILSAKDAGYTVLQGNVSEKVVPPGQVVPDDERTPDVGLRDYAAACGGLALAYIFQKGRSFERSMRLLDGFRSALAKRPATPAEATKMLAAVRRLSSVHLGRAACLELSTATALAAALRRRQVHVVLGVRSNPESPHAWPQAGDTPIRTEADEPIANVYQPLIRL